MLTADNTTDTLVLLYKTIFVFVSYELLVKVKLFNYSIFIYFIYIYY